MSSALPTPLAGTDREQPEFTDDMLLEIDHAAPRNLSRNLESNYYRRQRSFEERQAMTSITITITDFGIDH